MKSSTVFAAAALLLLAVTLFISGCNTWHGAGQDIERGGQKMQGK